MPSDQSGTRDETSPLRVDRRAGVVRLILNRPSRRNALSEELLAALETVLERIARERETRVVVIEGAGPVFCAGHDLAEMAGLNVEQLQALFSRCSRVMLGLRGLPQPVVARVHGLATAAGCQLVASCDLAVASQSASFATPGVKIGLFCTTPMIPLVRAIPEKAAMEMLLTGQTISAERAYQLGLVNRVVADPELDRAVDELTERLLAVSSEVIALGKRAFHELSGLTEADAYRRAIDVMVGNATLPDAREGIAAFLEKRPPTWPQP